MIVSNSGPLMYLTRISKLNLLKEIFKEIIIPKEIYEEVVVIGKEGHFLDAWKIEEAINQGWIKVQENIIDKELEKLFSQIDLGEIAVISLARKLKPDLVLIDDAFARFIAESFGFKVKGTIHVLLKAYSNKIIDKEEVKSLLRLLISEGFRMSSEFYAQVLDEIEKV